MPELDSQSPMPKWYQIKEILIKRIKEHRYVSDQVFCKQEDLIAEFGVSYITVSRALSELVREGYLYRRRGLGTFVQSKVVRHGTIDSIGLLVWDREHILEHPAFSRLVAGVSTPLRTAGYSLSFIFVNEENTKDGSLAAMVERAKVSALVAPFQPSLTAASLKPLVERELPIVLLNLDYPDISPYAVHFDMVGAIDTATTHLLTSGYRRVALMAPDNPGAPDYILGYRRAMQRTGISDEIIFTGFSEQPLAAEVQRILKTQEAPLGLVASDDTAALAAIRAAKEIGWSCPEQLGVVGVGDFIPAGLSEVPLTTILVPFSAMGQYAAEMVLSLLNSQAPKPCVRYLSPKLIARSTTADVRADKLVLQANAATRLV